MKKKSNFPVITRAYTRTLRFGLLFAILIGALPATVSSSFAQITTVQSGTLKITLNSVGNRRDGGNKYYVEDFAEVVWTVEDSVGRLSEGYTEIWDPTVGQWYGSPFGFGSTPSDYKKATRAPSHLLDGEGTWQFRITVKSILPAQTVVLNYSIKAERAPTAVTLSGVPETVYTNRPTSVTTEVTSIPIRAQLRGYATPIVRSVPTFPGSNLSVGAPIPGTDTEYTLTRRMRTFTINGTVTRPGGLPDRGEDDAVATMVVDFAYDGRPSFLPSTVSRTIAIRNATYQVPYYARAYPASNVPPGWVVPSDVVTRTYTIRRQ